METTPTDEPTTNLAIFRVAEIKEALLRVADPILCQVLAWLYSPEDSVTFMHDFPDAPPSLEPSHFVGFMTNYIYSTVFDKDRDALVNDIVLKIKAFPEFLHLATVLYHQNFPEYGMRDTPCFFLRTFIDIFRQAYERSLKKSPLKPGMLINFDQPQTICLHENDADMNGYTSFFADKDSMIFSFTARQKDLREKLKDLLPLVGLPREGEFISHTAPNASFGIFEWTTTPFIDRIPSSMERTEMIMAYLECTERFESWLMVHGDRALHQILRGNSQEAIMPRRTELIRAQFGGQIPVPPAGL
uniref:Similar to n=1 Tax=Steinernema glaseri TaxID=37863 RepID=A0A1I7YKX6_9BILA